jgi:hypothetical protein
MRTKHIFNCAICGKEQSKDWLYRGKHDDDPAICSPCFDEKMEIRVVEAGGDGEIRMAEFHNKITRERFRHPVRVVKAN